MPWVRIAATTDLEAGDVIGIDRDPLELVVWRASSGRVCVMDARCPHQWSYLGGEGVVDGDEIVCCAHYWRFDLDGRGSKRNILGRRDPKADIQVFAVRETAGAILVELPE